MSEFQKDDQKIYSSIRRIKRRRIDEVSSILNEWYGEERGKTEINAYFPKIVSLNDILNKILSNENYEEMEILTKIQRRWSELVGSEIYANSKPLSFKLGILTIQVKNSAWLAELKNFYSKVIESKLHSAFKQIKLKKIYFVSAGK